MNNYIYSTPISYYESPEFSECECRICFGTELLCSLCGAPDFNEGHCNLDGWEWVECGDCKHFSEDYMKDPDRKRDEQIDREMSGDCND
ncbi:hypothetical protein LCGC14_2834370 [marine sediment metagenome]|uniref:Uncharacterized protein n=1 Tax=marine sediment metagenome TaxID=412755 RepID=A0A0F8YDB7_9ZZZZ